MLTERDGVSQRGMALEETAGPIQVTRCSVMSVSELSPGEYTCITNDRPEFAV